MIVHDLKVLDLSISLKDFAQVPLLGAEVETKDAKTTAFPWIVLQLEVKTFFYNLLQSIPDLHTVFRNHRKHVHHRIFSRTGGIAAAIRVRNWVNLNQEHLIHTFEN